MNLVYKCLKCKICIEKAVCCAEMDKLHWICPVCCKPIGLKYIVKDDDEVIDIEKR